MPPRAASDTFLSNIKMLSVVHTFLNMFLTDNTDHQCWCCWKKGNKASLQSSRSDASEAHACWRDSWFGGDNMPCPSKAPVWFSVMRLIQRVREGQDVSNPFHLSGDTTGKSDSYHPASLLPLLSAVSGELFDEQGKGWEVLRDWHSVEFVFLYLHSQSHGREKNNREERHRGQRETEAPHSLRSAEDSLVWPCNGNVSKNWNNGSGLVMTSRRLPTSTTKKQNKTKTNNVLVYTGNVITKLNKTSNTVPFNLISVELSWLTKGR